MSPLQTEVGETYLLIADLTEATISAPHAIDVAEWVVETRHPVRSRLDRVFRGHTRAWWQAQALREHFERMESL